MLKRFILWIIFPSDFKIKVIVLLTFLSTVGVCVAGRACMVGACMAGRHAWQGGMRGRGCTWWGGMHGRGYAWQGACIVGRCGGCVHVRDACVVGGACMAGTCMAAGVHGGGGRAWVERRPLQRTVLILLECILV